MTFLGFEIDSKGRDVPRETGRSAGENGVGMSRSLVIVESPAKARTINKFLGKDFAVKSCMGHVRDLPERELGVDVKKGFKPEYEILQNKRKVVAELRSAGKDADLVYLATDPDREGEAIAWHIAQVMKLPDTRARRITFHEITRNAIAQAIEHPDRINMNKVDAQQARRVLDRLVGYQVSPLLWKTVRKGLSAGRVQSVALRMVSEREDAILAFTPEEFWTILVLLNNGKIVFEADLWKVDGKTAKIPDEEHASALAEEIRKTTFAIESIERKRQKRRPAPPFITSTLQQEAARKLQFSTKITMKVAQELYEGVEVKGESVGLITYMRTDSTHLAAEAVQAAREYVRTTYGEKYVPKRPNVYRNRESAQEAHEAIRPTSMGLPPEAVRQKLTRDQFRLYQLIWNRFVASQMEAQEFDVTTVVAAGGRRTPTEFALHLRTIVSVVAFDGYARVYSEGQDEEKEEVEHPIPRELLEAWERKLSGKASDPALSGYAAARVKPERHFTKPPARFSEATLVKELEARGIGRPSTYAQIISIILERNYVVKKEGKLFPTDLGRVVNRILVGQFPKLFNTEFTARMETELDRIEQGNGEWEAVLGEFYADFERTLAEAMSRRAEIKQSTIEKSDKLCAKCGRPMVVRFGPRGKFLSCSGFPECRNAEPLANSSSSFDIPVPEGVKCPVCGGPMNVRNGRFGEFLACANYPTCKGTLPIPTGVTCPRPGCGGQLVIKTSRRGKRFYSCDNYPECDVVYWDRPVPLSEPDPQSKLMFQLEKTRRDGSTVLVPAVYPPPQSVRWGKDGKRTQKSSHGKGSTDVKARISSPSRDAKKADSRVRRTTRTKKTTDEVSATE